MYFVLSKLAWKLINPISILVVIIGICNLVLVQGYWVLSLIILATLAVGLGVVAFLPVGELALRFLEARYLETLKIEGIAGIIVLSGGPEVVAKPHADSEKYKISYARLVAGIALSFEHPEAKFLFTGRSKKLQGATMSVAAHDIQMSDINPRLVILEEQARTTAENATFSKVAVGDRIEGTWVLVTSAYHMRRALASFQAAGWPKLIAYPVHRLGRPEQTNKAWILGRNLKLLNIAMKEWMGLIGYRLTGRA